MVQGDEGDAEREEGDDDDVVCCVCLNGDETEGNVILLCDGEHDLTMGVSSTLQYPPFGQDSGWLLVLPRVSIH